ncbi:MAG: hypothetical protein ACXADB_10310, partial [Candidatus Hermodarchaeia archaeon]
MMDKQISVVPVNDITEGGSESATRYQNYENLSDKWLKDNSGDVLVRGMVDTRWKLSKFMGIWRWIKRLWLKISKILFHYIYLIQKVLRSRSIADPEYIYWIDPHRIVEYTNYCCGDRLEFERGAAERIRTQSFRGQVFDRIKDRMKIYGGDWDISNYKFSQLDIYKAIDLRMNFPNLLWDQTPFFENVLARIEDGEILWGCKNRRDLLQRMEYTDQLIRSIQEDGFLVEPHGKQNQGRIRKSLWSGSPNGTILVNVGRNGKYLFQDGRHRLAIAKILNLNKIPVRVLVRHEKWQGLRDLLFSIARKNGRQRNRSIL